MVSAGEFLRKMRARMVPGVVDGAARRRRTPGLRREEVAERANMSLDWYVRLEQDRAERPSSGILDAVARALELSGAERRYLYRLARGEPPAPAVSDDIMHPSLAAALLLLREPALVLGPRYDVLGTNPPGEALFGGFGEGPFGRNAAWFTLCDPRARALFPEFQKVARETVGTVRGAFARQPLDRRFLALVAELSQRSPLFVELWGDQHVAEKGIVGKRFLHPVAGLLDCTVHALSPPDAEGQNLLLMVAKDATTRSRLPLLASVAAQPRKRRLSR